VVRTGKIVTAAGVAAGIDMALWLVGETAGPERARAIQLDIEYDPRPPFDSGHPSKATAAVRRTALADQARLVSGLRAGGTLAETASGARKLLWRSMINRIRG